MPPSDVVEQPRKRGQATKASQASGLAAAAGTGLRSALGW
eukprot:COSAG02_NODE_58377_length_277_cov_1.157303_2_plen_39_part_01